MSDELSFAEEGAADVDAVDRLTVAAFGRPDEARLVQELRRRGGLTLSAVARVGGRAVAHVAYSPLGIGGCIASPAAVALAPVSVTPEQQRRGVGSALIWWSLEQLRRRGFPAVIVLGEPAFYSRFGFRPASEFEIRCPYDVPGEYFMALELHAGGLGSASGLVEYRPEFATVS